MSLATRPFESVVAVGGKGGYVGRDGQLVDPADVERRAAFG